MSDTLYYNISIDNTSQSTSGLTHGANAFAVNPNIVANNSTPILPDPSLYYGSIIRFSVPCFTVPLIQFLVNTPVSNINQGIYSFTLEYNGVYSDQTYYEYVPQVSDAPLPKVGTTQQDFTSFYYFVYGYSNWIDFQNKCLASAFANLAGKTTLPADAVSPYFFYDSSTQLISLYAQNNIYNQSLATPINIYFNTVCQQYFNGFSFTEVAVGSANGADALLLVTDVRGKNLETIDSISYVVMAQEFVSLAYLSPLKNILITTNMNVNSEVFYLNQPGTGQNNDFINVLTDFIPDLSNSGGEAGIGSKIFIYNAPSLYRVFEFKTNTPLYSVSVGISWVDQLGNIYPLYLTKGTIATIKIMFIKKTAFNKFLL